MAGKGSREKWRMRFVVAMIVIISLVLVGVAYQMYVAYRQAATQVVLERDRQATYLSAIRMRDELARFSEELATIARSKDMTLGLTARKVAELRSSADRTAIFDGGIVLLDGFGKVQGVQPPRPALLESDWSDRDFFRALLTSTKHYYTTADDLGPNGASVVVVSVPILGESGELMGALVGMFQMGQTTISSFYASIVRLRINDSGNAFVVNGTGRVLYDSGNQRVGEVMQLPWGKANDARGGAFRTTDPDGNQIVLAHAPIPGTDWFLLSEDDWVRASQPIRQYAGGLAVLLALGLALPPLGLVLMMRQRRSEALEIEQANLESRMAALMFERVLPKQTPLLSGYDVAVRSIARASDSVPSDFYDLTLLRDGKLVVVLGSVNARSMMSAYLMATARAGFRAASWERASAAQAMSQCNLLLCPETESDTTITSAYAILDPVTGRLQYSVAGQPAPFRWREEVLSQTDIQSEGLLLGRRIDEVYYQDEIFLEPGDGVILTSRGFTELTNARGEPFESRRLTVALNGFVGETTQLADAIAGEVRAFVGENGPVEADLTVILLTREPLPIDERNAARLTKPDVLVALGETDIDL